MIPTVVLHLYSEFCPNRFRFGGVVAENAPWPAKVIAGFCASLSSPPVSGPSLYNAAFSARRRKCSVASSGRASRFARLHSFETEPIRVCMHDETTSQLPLCIADTICIHSHLVVSVTKQSAQQMRNKGPRR